MSQHLANYHQVGFPLGIAEIPWTLEFLQSRLCHIGQVLRGPLDDSLFSPILALHPRLCVPLGFRLISGKGVDLWGTPGNFPRLLLGAMNFRRETAHSFAALC